MRFIIHDSDLNIHIDKAVRHCVHTFNERKKTADYQKKANKLPQIFHSTTRLLDAKRSDSPETLLSRNNNCRRFFPFFIILDVYFLKGKTFVGGL